MDTMDKTNLRDERLLADFFAAHQQSIPDNGFTERVMKEVSARSRILQMRRLSLRLNILGAVGVVAILLYMGVFTETLESVNSVFTHVTTLSANFDPDSLLVVVMLFVHRLPDYLPSPTQFLAIVLTTIILMALVIRRVVDGADHGYIP